MTWNQHFDWILQQVPIGIHVVNHKGTTLFYNETMAQIDGLERNQVLGQNVFQLFPSLTKETSTLNLALERKEEINEQVQTYVNMRGKQITTINRTFPLFQDGEISGAVEIAQDITNIMKLSEQIFELRQQLVKSNKDKSANNNTATYNFDDLIGENEAFQHALFIAKKASRTHSPVMIYGLTGTGKELIAHSIHSSSIRHDRPFIALNCAAVPKELMEGILFGTTKGAFTGAIDRIGIFEQANGGTLFLDELNSMDLQLQAKLLRTLQDQRIRRLGGLQEQEIDVRLITAMNISPEQAMEQGTLRSDLYYRLHVVSIFLPPLNERTDDILPLTRFFIEKFNSSFGRSIKGLTPQTRQLLQTYHWPGNVRELEHAIESAFNLLEPHEPLIDLHHLPMNLSTAPDRTQPLPSSAKEHKISQINLPHMLRELERSTIEEIWNEYRGNVSKTAEALGMKRQSLQYKLKKYGIELRHRQ